MKKILIILVLAVVLVGGGIKALLWWSVKSDVDAALTSMRVKADVKYEGVGAGFSDGVTLEKALIKPAGSRDEFLIDELTVIPRIPEDLEQAMRMYGKDVYPAELEVIFKGLHIDINRPLPRLFRDTPFEKISLGNILAYGCGKPPAIDTVELQKMGYSSLVFNGRFSYRYDQMKGKIKGDFEISAPGYGSGTGDFATDLPSLSKPGVITGLLNNKFTSFNATVRDDGFQKRYIDFCSKESGLDKEAFVKVHIKRMRTLFSRFGITPNDAALQPIAGYQSEAGTLTLSFAVPKDTDFASLKGKSAEAVGELLGVEISHNGKAAEKPGATFDLMQFAEAVYLNSYEGSQWRTFVPEPPKKRRVTRKKYMPSYKVVSLERLPQYKGRQIRVTSHRGNVKEGLFKELRGKEIFISRQIGTGEGVFRVYSYDTRKIEIYY